MRIRRIVIWALVLTLISTVGWFLARKYYPQLVQQRVVAEQRGKPAGPLEERIRPPRGFRRVSCAEGSFCAFLRSQRLKAGCPDIKRYNGTSAPYQGGHCAVLDVDVGRRDLQQCADAYMRLWAEYLWSQRRFSEIRFRFTSGDWANYADWREGLRPEVRNERVTWKRIAQPDGSYTSFRAYLDVVFGYCGTHSLERDLPRVRTADMKPGDAFIRGGFPGHLVFVVDMAENPTTGEKVFLLAQGSTPAQEIHIVLNPADGDLSPWFPVDFGRSLDIPLWTFFPNQLHRFGS